MASSSGPRGRMAGTGRANCRSVWAMGSGNWTSLAPRRPRLHLRTRFPLVAKERGRKVFPRGPSVAAAEFFVARFVAVRAQAIAFQEQGGKDGDAARSAAIVGVLAGVEAEHDQVVRQAIGVQGMVAQDGFLLETKVAE